MHEYGIFTLNISILLYANGWSGQRFFNVCRFCDTKCNTFITSKNFLMQGNEREDLLILPYIWFIKKSKLWKMEGWIGIPMSYNLIKFLFSWWPVWPPFIQQNAVEIIKIIIIIIIIKINIYIWFLLSTHPSNHTM